MVELIILVFTLTLASPLTTGAVAFMSGRSFWRWFLAGACIPGLSFFVLFWFSRNDHAAGDLADSGRAINPPDGGLPD